MILSPRPRHGGARSRPKRRLFAPPRGAAAAYSAPAAMNDLRIKPFDFQAAVARAGLRPDGTPAAGAAGSAGAVPGGFRTAMASALQEVSRSQLEAQNLQRELALDNPGVSLEQTMLAMQKAQLGFTAAVQVRNRLLQAYSEIMNMQV